MEHLRCVVERITYQNVENGYSVIKCRAKGYQDLVTVVGSMPDVHVGSVLYLGGSWRIDGKYGRQFAMETFEETLPATVYGIEKYLGSGLVKGVGPKFAGRIVKQFGADTLNVIEEDPDRLLDVVGIGKVRVERIKKSWQEQKEIKNIMLFLQSHDVSTSHATKIYKTYGNDSIKIVQENPYRLADDIWGIGFKTADTIAEKMGFDHEKYVRLRSGILYTLNKLSEDGHCYATREMLLKTGGELLSVEENVLSMTLDEMIRAEDVITEPIPLPEDAAAGAVPDKAIYLPPFYFSEVGTARRLAAIYANADGIHVNPEGLSERISLRTRMQYDEIQMQAILTAVQSKVLVLTGGPGTGKTTTTLGIITAFREAGANILLAAPTGRAAKRLSEATRMEAKTIHRLLEVKPPEGYQKNEENPLEGDVLIVDECSMIDIMLMYNLLKAIPDTMTLILVGDIDQLPSVGAGNVLRDIIDSERFPVVRLTRVFRQAQTSRIIMNAHRINSGKMPDISNGAKSDFFFMDMENQAQKKGLNAEDSGILADESAKTITELVTTKLSRYYKTPASEIQVLTPMQRGVVGAVNLNQVLQQALNPGEVGLKRGGYIFRANDKVMQIRNNYDKEVFNGDIGVIGSVDLEERELTVNFDDRLVTYDVTELDELVLAYATTIHKSQGSEYPIVVIPVLMNHFVMLQRNLIYTGITRAKKVLVLVGTKKALGYAVRNVTVSKRNTMLKDRLQRMQSKPVTMPAAKKPRAMPDVSASFPAQQKPPHSEMYRYPDRPALVQMVAEPHGVYGQTNTEVSASSPASEPEKISHEEWLKRDLFVRLGQSKFRSRFRLTEADREYVREKGMEAIRSHAAQIIRQRLADAEPKNDGKQTPMRGAPQGHPVFLGQHATGTCCRGCLEKWHGIPKGRPLSEEEQSRIVDVLMQWIERQMKDGV
ncbi:MAG: ATP-dependent RecD-like DNA helicase [Firmicutes bacterium]|nr:ATP-dependent RecD-like DNA helicase [Bacillota bacterium]